MADLLDLAKRMVEVQRNLKSERERVVKEVAKTILNVLVQNTPVDTSQALSNWQASINSPITNTRYAINPGRFGSTKASSAAIAYALGELEIDKFKVGQEIHITNNLDYIEGLDNGTISKQPDRFVDKALQISKVIANSQDVTL